MSATEPTAFNAQEETPSAAQQVYNIIHVYMNCL